MKLSADLLIGTAVLRPQWWNFVGTAKAYGEYLESFAGTEFSPGSIRIWFGPRDGSTYRGQEFRVMREDESYWKWLISTDVKREVDYSKHLLNIERRWTEYKQRFPLEEAIQLSYIYFDDDIQKYRKGGEPLRPLYLYYVDDATYEEISSALELPQFGPIDRYLQRPIRDLAIEDPFWINGQADQQPQIKNEAIEERPRGRSPANEESLRAKSEADVKPKDEKPCIKSEVVEVPRQERQRQETPSPTARIKMDPAEEEGALPSSSGQRTPVKRERSMQMPLTPPTTTRVETRNQASTDVKGETDWEQDMERSPSKKQKWRN